MIPATLTLLLAALGAAGSPVEYAKSFLCHHTGLTFIRPRAADGLNTRAVAAGKQYFGSATDNGELSDSAYVAGLSNTADFGQITPGNSMKVRSIIYQ
jgi:endo-1,4-beta-xylanase